MPCTTLGHFLPLSHPSFAAPISPELHVGLTVNFYTGALQYQGFLINQWLLWAPPPLKDLERRLWWIVFNYSQACKRQQARISSIRALRTEDLDDNGNVRSPNSTSLLLLHSACCLLIAAAKIKTWKIVWPNSSSSAAPTVQVMRDGSLNSWSGNYCVFSAKKGVQCLCFVMWSQAVIHTAFRPQAKIHS